MGLIDRDYMAERDHSDFRPIRSGVSHWYWIVPLTILVLLVTTMPIHWMPPQVAAQVQHLRLRLGVAHAPQAHSAPAHQFRELPATPIEAQLAQAQQQAPTANSVRRCLVNGVVVNVLNGDCPPPAPLTPVAQQLPAVTRAPEPADNPFFKPGTIYRCKSYSGAVFWAQSHCSQHKAVIERIASVPVGMPFQQQVDIASAQAQSLESQLRGEQREDARRVTCQTLRLERDQIWKRSGTGTGYVPLDVLGADQTRWRQIESQLSQNNCGR